MGERDRAAGSVLVRENIEGGAARAAGGRSEWFQRFLQSGREGERVQEKRHEGPVSGRPAGGRAKGPVARQVAEALHSDVTSPPQVGTGSDDGPVAKGEEATGRRTPPRTKPASSLGKGREESTQGIDPAPVELTYDPARVPELPAPREEFRYAVKNSGRQHGCPTGGDGDLQQWGRRGGGRGGGHRRTRQGTGGSGTEVREGGG